MMNNDEDSQRDNSSNEDPEERRPTKKKKKNLLVLDSDKEDSQIESDNKIDRSVDSKEEKSNEKKKSTRYRQREKFVWKHNSKDALSYFVTTNGEAFDSGSQKLVDQRELPYFNDLQIGVASVCKRGIRFHFALPVSNNSGDVVYSDFETHKDSLSQFSRTIGRNGDPENSLSKTETIGNVPWNHVATELHLAFLWSLTKVIVCQNIIRYPPRDEREEIMKEMHSSAIGGHRGVTKTYIRIRQHYFWENIKTDIQNFIQQCSSITISSG